VYEGTRAPIHHGHRRSFVTGHPGFRQLTDDPGAKNENTAENKSAALIISAALLF